MARGTFFHATPVTIVRPLANALQWKLRRPGGVGLVGPPGAQDEPDQYAGSRNNAVSGNLGFAIVERPARVCGVAVGNDRSNDRTWHVSSRILEACPLVTGCTRAV